MAIVVILVMVITAIILMVIDGYSNNGYYDYSIDGFSWLFY
jgi:hypothetical protein